MTDTDSTKDIRLAVLMTCHNRITNTLKCLTALKKQQLLGATIEVFLADDGCSDGTAQATLSIFPNATIIQGDGNLYWCGGMRLAFASAIQKDYDFYLWLNDDTHLDEDALTRVYQTYTEAAAQLGDAVIVVGSTREQESGMMTYGGWRQCVGKLGSISWEKMAPNPDTWIACDTMNGNCVLIPRSVVEKNGNLSENFTHSMGDLDYGLRTTKSGCQIVIAPGYYGVCSANDGCGLWTDTRLPVFLRWKKLLSAKGLPISEWFVFCRRHKGTPWILVWLSPYLMFWMNALLQLIGRK